MDECRHRFYHRWHAPALNSLVQILSDSRDLDWVTIALKHVHVLPGPALDEGRNESGRKTEYEAHIPADIHPDVRC